MREEQDVTNPFHLIGHSTGRLEIIFFYPLSYLLSQNRGSQAAFLYREMDKGGGRQGAVRLEDKRQKHGENDMWNYKIKYELYVFLSHAPREGERKRERTEVR